MKANNIHCVRFVRELSSFSRLNRSVSARWAMDLIKYLCAIYINEACIALIKSFSGLIT